MVIFKNKVTVPEVLNMKHKGKCSRQGPRLRGENSRLEIMSQKDEKALQEHCRGGGALGNRDR
jgi:hypothetical protein